MIELATMMLGSQPKTDDRSYEDIFVDRYLAFNEGTEAHGSLEDNTTTHPYGIKYIEEKYKKLPFRDQAVLMTGDHIREIKKQIGEKNWNSLPRELQFAASDTYWNSKSLFKNFKTKLIEGDAQGAFMETLDIVTGRDKRDGKKYIYGGHANRRARNYNEWARKNGEPLFKSYQFEKAKDGGTILKYNYTGDKEPEVLRINRPLRKGTEYREYPVINYED